MSRTREKERSQGKRKERSQSRQTSEEEGWMTSKRVRSMIFSGRRLNQDGDISRDGERT